MSALASPELDVTIVEALRRVENGIHYDDIRPSYIIVIHEALARNRRRLAADIPLHALFWPQFLLPAFMTGDSLLWLLLSLPLGLLLGMRLRYHLRGPRSLSDDRRIDQALRLWRSQAMVTKTA